VSEMYVRFFMVSCFYCLTAWFSKKETSVVSARIIYIVLSLQLPQLFSKYVFFLLQYFHFYVYIQTCPSICFFLKYLLIFILCSSVDFVVSYMHNWAFASNGLQEQYIKIFFHLMDLCVLNMYHVQYIREKDVAVKNRIQNLIQQWHWKAFVASEFVYVYKVLFLMELLNSWKVQCQNGIKYVVML
jgi:hypothetical protein